ncbi:endolytic transglycosylase MltG [Simiduia sp. 21SJ11W-1]|uniref:endolytic transglycosylase MltG n=1 Tax=Simiduia sp. 21SJ11W-1 TaxID=2909669 RepID=UPI00209DFC20|nr:endolytic transglycosylase MltG [Simiduia sp. 21SJ11W-1]UTA46340.1 endolytic transglycosylase MltG [Simiduia sp. 21SJ11W-1]
MLGARSYLLQWAEKPLAIEHPVQLEVPKGQSLIALANKLERQGLLHARAWVSYARITGQTQIKAGEYAVAPGTSAAGLLQQLIEGEVVQYVAQIIEGWTYYQALQHLHSLEFLEPRLAGLDWEAQSQLLGLHEPHPEGWFFPDTYHYQKGDSDVTVLRQAYAKQQQILAELWAARAPNLPYDSPYDALIMASIVEKETAIDAEREQIAGVFVRRLQKGMRLQTDPTVIYGLGERYAGNITRKHLAQHTPYNTYRINGLPPTPIALPGRRSLYASLHPDAGSSLYFVAKGDGYHQFSDTLEQHNAAVKKYQYRRRAGYRSTPEAP